MQHLRVDPNRPDASIVQQAAAIILAGGVVAYPTDTLYGLAVSPLRADALKRLFDVKERVADQPIPLIAADLDQAMDAGEMTALARRLAAVFWPGPLTLVIPASPRIAGAVHAGTGRVAVRVPDHQTARLLAAACGTSITSTSANLSGSPPTALPDDVVRTLSDRIDALLDGGATAGGLPSTIIDASGDRPLLLRAGVVPFERVLECV